MQKNDPLCCLTWFLFFSDEEVDVACGGWLSRKLFEKTPAQLIGRQHACVFFPEQLIPVLRDQIVHHIPQRFGNRLEYGEQIPRHVEFGGDFNGSSTSGKGAVTPDKNDGVKTRSIDAKMLE